MTSNAVKGFTLIELMMTLSVAAILLTIAVPSYITFTQNSRLTKQVNLLSASVAAARGEAAKRGSRVVLCQSENPVAETCSVGTTGTWSNGWVVFVDKDNSLTINTGDTVVGVFQPETGVNIITDAGSTLAFNPDGTTTESTTKTFAVCDSRGVSKGKKLEVAATGRPSSSAATTCAPS